MNPEKSVRSIRRMCVATGACCLLASFNAHAELHLLFNLADGDDRQAWDAGPRLADALDGTTPTRIDGDAPRYYVKLEATTLESFDGSATRVGDAPGTPGAAVAVTGAAASASSSAAAAPHASSTGWVAFDASVVSVMLISADGAGQESDVRYEPARLFVQQQGDDVIVMLTDGSNQKP